MIQKAALILLLATAPAAATEAYYEVYAAGMNVVDVAAAFEITPDRYRVQVGYRTVGGLGLVMRNQQVGTVEGRFLAGAPTPERFVSTGTYRGVARVTRIDYRAGQPLIRELQPPNEAEREVVPPDRQANTIDTLSAMANLINQVNTTGRCEGKATTFDGRRLAQLEAKTAGEQTLEPTSRSTFAGKTLRCDFIGRQLAGFNLDDDRERLQKPQTGTAWFAAITPGGPKIPVRVAFQTRWFGEATMHLTKKPILTP